MYPTSGSPHTELELRYIRAALRIHWENRALSLCVCVCVSRRAWRTETSSCLLWVITSPSLSSFSTWPWCQMPSSRSPNSGFIFLSLLMHLSTEGPDLHDSDTACFYRTKANEIKRGSRGPQCTRRRPLLVLLSGQGRSKSPHVWLQMQFITGFCREFPRTFFKGHLVWNPEHP